MTSAFGSGILRRLFASASVTSAFGSGFLERPPAAPSVNAGQRGQALVFAVLALAIGAAAVAGLRSAQDRLLQWVRDDRAGEAAVQAAGTIVADAQLASVRPGSGAEHATFSVPPSVQDDALRAATALSAANGGGVPASLSVRDAGERMEITLQLGSRSHRVSVDKIPCCPR